MLMPVASRREIRLIAQYTVCAPCDHMGNALGDDAAAAGTDIALLRLDRRYRLNRPLDATAHLGALPSGEQALERIVAARFRTAAVRPRHLGQYQPTLCEWFQAPHGVP